LINELLDMVIVSSVERTFNDFADVVGRKSETPGAVDRFGQDVASHADCLLTGSSFRVIGDERSLALPTDDESRRLEVGIGAARRDQRSLTEGSLASGASLPERMSSAS
jgi:hypothetical protein